MQIVRDLAGYSYGRSDLVRRAMAKKKHKVMDEEREIFVHGLTDENGQIKVPGCVRNGVDEKTANEIYDEMISFASYAFNKSHAAAYSVVAMQTAWLKRYYPVQFMAAMLNSVYGNAGKIAGYIQYCRGRGIPVLPPDINRSRWKFTVDLQKPEQPSIRFGLGAVKGVGENAVQAIVQEREKTPYQDLFDFCRRIDTAECNKRVVENLIRAGAFDSMGANRPQMLAVYEQALEANQNLRKKNVAGQMSLFDMFGGPEEDSLFKELRTYPAVADCPARVKLQMEKEATGVYMTGHPLDDWQGILRQMSFSSARAAEMAEMPDHGLSQDGKSVEMGGILTAVNGKSTKKGDYMAFVTLEDMTGQTECLVFPKVYERYQPLLQEDELAVMTGRLSVREEEDPKLIVETICRMEDWEKQRESREGKTAPRAPKAAANPAADARMAAGASRKLFVRLERKDLDRAQAMLALEAGDIPVYLHIPAEKITLLAPRESWCSGSESCLRRLREELGEGNVVLKESTLAR